MWKREIEVIMKPIGGFLMCGADLLPLALEALNL